MRKPIPNPANRPAMIGIVRRLNRGRPLRWNEATAEVVADVAIYGHPEATPTAISRARRLTDEWLAEGKV